MGCQQQLGSSESTWQVQIFGVLSSTYFWHFTSRRLLCSSKKPWTYRNLLSFYFIQHKSEPLTLYRYNCSKYGNFIQIMFIKYTWCQVKLTLAAKIQHLSTRRHTGEVGSHLIIDKLSSYSALTESVLYNRAGTKFHFKICGYHNHH